MMNSKETYKRFPNGEIVKSNLLRQRIMILAPKTYQMVYTI